MRCDPKELRRTVCRINCRCRYKMPKQVNVILDLDQTLISAEADEEYDFEKNKEKAKLFEFEDMDGYYIVFARPGLQEFLDYLFANFNVSVWTAASKDYALFIIEKMILANKDNRKLDWIFFSYHCDLSEEHKGSSKDLSTIWDVHGIEGYGKDNTVILDDYDEVYNAQPGNCVVAPPFEFTEEGSEHDSFLETLRGKLVSMQEHVDKGGTDPAKVVNDS